MLCLDSVSCRVLDVGTIQESNSCFLPSSGLTRLFSCEEKRERLIVETIQEWNICLEHARITQYVEGPRNWVSNVGCLYAMCE